MATMLVTLTKMKEYLGITSSTPEEDNFLTAQIQLVSEAIEDYTKRHFPATNYIQTWYNNENPRSYELRTYHYPIISVVTDGIKQDGVPLTGSRINKKYGLLTRPYGYFGGWGDTEGSLTVQYRAGYEEIPLAIQSVVFSLVGERWNRRSAGVDVNFGAGVQRVSIPGTISIDFDYSQTSNDLTSTYGMILGDYVNILSQWKSDRAILGGGEIENVDEVI